MYRIHIYIYIYVCVCVCVCVYDAKYFLRKERHSSLLYRQPLPAANPPAVCPVL
jgi:hypothetical protein